MSRTLEGRNVGKPLGVVMGRAGNRTADRFARAEFVSAAAASQDAQESAIDASLIIAIERAEIDAVRSFEV